MADDDIIVEAEGGIGGIGAEAPKPRRRAAPSAPEPGSLGDVDELPPAPEPVDPLKTLHEMLAAQGDLIEAQRQTLVQLQGQMGQVDQGFARYNNIIQTLDQRMVAIARQVARNTRRDALELAIKAQGGAHMPADKITAAAATYLKFLEPPQPEPVAAPPEVGFGDAAEPPVEEEPPPQTTH
jgi:hypothetical protein